MQTPTTSVSVLFVLLGFDGGCLWARAEGQARWVECGVSQEANREQLELMRGLIYGFACVWSEWVQAGATEEDDLE